MPEVSKTKTDAVSEYIIELISEKALPESGKIPSENVLSQKLNVSRVTVRRAISELVFRGILRTEHGRGSFAVDYKNIINADITVPVIISSIEKESRFLDIYSGAQNYLSKKGINTVFSSSDYRTANEKKYISSFFEEGCRNMLVMPIALEDNSEFYHNFMKKGASFVFIDQRPPEIPCNYVHSDNFSGMFSVTEHLINLGHRRIAYIYQEMPELSSSTFDRLSGYKYALKSNDITNTGELICYTNRRICTNTLEHLLSLPKPPTAIIANNDYLAHTIYELLILRGLSVPDDISVAGFDNLTIPRPNGIGITTVDQDFYAVGYNAAKLLYNIIEEPNGIISDITVPTEPIFRESTGIPPEDSRHI